MNARGAGNDPVRVLGLISGTSADAVDAALVRIEERGGAERRVGSPTEGRRADQGRIAPRIRTHGRARVTLESFVALPFSTSMRNRVLAVAHGAAVGAAEIADLDHRIGERFAEAALAALKSAKIAPSRVEAIGSHGQTVYHAPRARIPVTFQIGNPHVIAERTGIRVVSDFRRRDVAAGGEGAPLVPMAHFDLFADESVPRAVQNLGGIGNVTVLPAGRKADGVFAFDTGPANMVLDGLARAFTAGRRRMDRGGALSRKGQVDDALLEKLMKDSFFRHAPPKSTGREAFGRAFTARLTTEGKRRRMSPEDLMATAAELTARSVADGYRRFVIPRVSIRETLLCGGGVHNHDVVRRIRRLLTPLGVDTRSTRDLGVDPDAVEAIAFALLAYDTLRGRPGNVPSATGARGPRVLGSVVPGAPRPDR